MQTTYSGTRSVEEELDFEPPPPDPVRLIPVDFGLPDGAVRETEGRDAFELSPAAFAISPLEVPKDTNPVADRDGLDRGDFAQDLEVHARASISGRRAVRLCASRFPPCAVRSA